MAPSDIEMGPVVAKVTFSEPDQVLLYAALKTKFIKVRGYDLVTSPGKRIRIPRTTNRDIIALMRGWQSAIKAVQEGGGIPFQKIVAKWTPAGGDFVVMTEAGGPDELFLDNPRFWDVTARLAIALASLRAIPTEWTMMVESIGEAVVEAPQVIGEATGVAAKAAGKIAGSVVGGFFEGMGVGGIFLLAAGAYVITRKRRW